MKPTFKEITHRSTEWTEAVRLRKRILREPLGSKFTDEELEEEKNHFQIAGFSCDAIIATAVLVPEGDEMKMQRVVVMEHMRSLNIGSEMMIFLRKICFRQELQSHVLSR